MPIDDPEDSLAPQNTESDLPGVPAALPCGVRQAGDGIADMGLAGPVAASAIGARYGAVAPFGPYTPRRHSLGEGL